VVSTSCFQNRSVYMHWFILEEGSGNIRVTYHGDIVHGEGRKVCRATLALTAFVCTIRLRFVLYWRGANSTRGFLFRMARSAGASASMHRIGPGALSNNMPQTVLMGKSVVNWERRGDEVGICCQKCARSPEAAACALASYGRPYQRLTQICFRQLL